MSKRVLVGLAVLAVASTAMAVPVLTALTPVGTQTASDARAITPDGKYVVGNSGTVGALWSVSNPTGGIAVIGNSIAAETATGVGYRTVNGQQQLVIHGGSSGGWSTNWVSADGGATFPQTVRPVTTGTAHQIHAANTLGSTGANDTWFNSYRLNTSSTDTLRVITGSGDPPAGFINTKDTPTDSNIRGVSSNGVAVGYRTGASPQPTGRLNYIVWPTGTGGLNTAYFNGLNGTIQGEAFGVSGDGNMVFGLSPVSDGRTGNWPYMFNRTTSAIVELPHYADTAGSVTNGVAYGATFDGRYAVGMNYRGSEKAVLWDTVNGTVTDLTDFAIANGILGDFTGNLRRAYSIGLDELGQPVITGMGVNSAGLTRGFVMTIPEPSTMLFLALGGLALIRRR